MGGITARMTTSPLAPPPPSHPLLHHSRPVLVQHLLQVTLPGHALAAAAVTWRGPALLAAEEEPAYRRRQVGAEWAQGWVPHARGSGKQG